MKCQHCTSQFHLLCHRISPIHPIWPDTVLSTSLATKILECRHFLGSLLSRVLDNSIICPSLLSCFHHCCSLIPLQVTVFRMGSEGQQDVEMAILTALLKGEPGHGVSPVWLWVLPGAQSSPRSSESSTHSRMARPGGPQGRGLWLPLDHNGLELEPLPWMPVRASVHAV